MNVKIIAGRETSARNDHILNEIKQLIKESPLTPVTVIVSPQATFLTEKFILEKLNLKGMMGLSVVGPEKLTQKICDNVCGRAIKMIDTVGRSMMVKLLCEQNAKDLPTLRKCFGAKDIWGNLAELFGELKTLDVTPKMLKETEFEDKFSREKINDIAFLYEEFETLRETLGVTGGDRTNIAIENIKDADFIKDSHFFVMNFDMFTSQMIRYMAEIGKYAKSMTISLLGDKKGEELFGATRQVKEKLSYYIGCDIKTHYIEKQDKKSSDILFLDKNLYAFSPEKNENAKGDIEIIAARDKEEEVFAAREIVARLIKRGYSYNDIAIVTGDMQGYGPFIKRLFTEADIPTFVDMKRDLSKKQLCPSYTFLFAYVRRKA